MKLGQKGFGAVEIILLLVIVGILGFVGFRAYQNYTTEDPDISQQTTRRLVDDESEQEDSNEDDNFIAIEQWDVKFNYNDEYDISYELDGYTNQAGETYSNYFAKFSSTELNDTELNCTNKVTLVRGKEDQVAITGDGPEDSNYTFADAYADQQDYSNGIAFKFDDYYIVKLLGGASCGDELDSIKDSILESLRTLVPAS